MLALPAHGFCVLSMPKCASTALEEALAPRAEMVLTHTPRLKHINCQLFHDKVQPVLRQAGYRREDYELVSLFREPVSWLESWWRYRSGHHLKRRGDDPSYAGEMSFEDFARAYVDRAPQREVGGRIAKGGVVVKGRPARFVALDASYRVGVDRLFALERPEAWTAYVRQRLGGPVPVRAANRSLSARRPELSAQTRARLEEHFAPEYDLYAHLRATGEWRVPADYVPAGVPVTT